MSEASKRFSELVTSLREKGKAVVEADSSREVKAARTQLKEAAHRANVRISMKVKKTVGGSHEVHATVLTPEEADKQFERDTIFSAVNRIRSGIEILTTGAVDLSEIDDDVEDLKEITDDLEDYARQLIGGATG